ARTGGRGPPGGAGGRLRPRDRRARRPGPAVGARARERGVPPARVLADGALLKAAYKVAFEPIKARARVGKSKIRALRDGIAFLLIILKIVTLYRPLKVFFPVSLAAFAMGVGYGAWNVYHHG